MIDVAKELKRLNMSQYELAHRLGISQTTVWKLARKYQTPTPEQEEAIREALWKE